MIKKYVYLFVFLLMVSFVFTHVYADDIGRNRIGEIQDNLDDLPNESSSHGNIGLVKESLLNKIPGLDFIMGGFSDLNDMSLGLFSKFLVKHPNIGFLVALFLGGVIDRNRDKIIDVAKKMSRKLKNIVGLDVDDVEKYQDCQFKQVVFSDWEAELNTQVTENDFYKNVDIISE